MEIQQDLPQFSGKKALFIVSGEFLVKYYLAHNGRIRPLEQFAVANPRAELQEDFLTTTKLGISGSIYEWIRQELQRKLTRRMLKVTENLEKEHSFTDVYLFYPDFMKNMVEEALPKTMRERVRMEHPRDLLNYHPFKILELIKTDEDEKRDRSEVLSSEEMRILRGHSVEE